MEPGDGDSHALDNAQVAIAHPAGITGRTGDLVRAFVVSAIGPDFQGRDPRLDPDFVWSQVARIQWLFLNSQVSGAVQDGDFHTSSW
jgi:hypothetical protein